MGYYTKYTLVVTPSHYDTVVRNRLAELSNYQPSPFIEDDPKGVLNGGDGCKWYDHEAHAVQIASELPPSVTFTIVRVGEDYKHGGPKPTLKPYQGCALAGWETLHPHDPEDW